MAKKNILFLVHIEEMFRKYFPDDLYIHRLIKAHYAAKYDQVFHLISGIESYNFIDELAKLPHKEIEWGWGYEPEVGYDPCTCEGDEHDPDNEQCDMNRWVIRADSAHEWTWIPEELRDFPWRETNVYIGGGYDGECLADFESILNHFGVNYTKVDGYVYG